MKKPLLITFMVLVAGAGLISFINRCSNKPPVTVAAQGFAVVELFTSEGCSSCPPADVALAKIAKENKGNVYVLGFHVDYWDRLGWKDAFSNAVYTERQQQYAAIMKLNSVYTPQAIVNGKTEFVGSDESKIRQSVQSALNGATGASIEVTAKTADAKTVNVSYQTTNAGKKILNLALVQLHAATAVKAGENSGSLLQHINIVRDFKAITIGKENTGTASLAIPAGLTAKDCKVIAYLQDKDLMVTGATESNIQQ